MVQAGRDLHWSRHSLFMVSVTLISMEHSEQLNSICFSYDEGSAGALNSSVPMLQGQQSPCMLHLMISNLSTCG